MTRCKNGTRRTKSKNGQSRCLSKMYGPNKSRCTKGYHRTKGTKKNRNGYCKIAKYKL